MERAAFANPFSAERAALDSEIAGGQEITPGPELTARVVAAVEERVRQLTAGGQGRVDRLAGDDRDLVRSALLFESYHRFTPAIDRHIDEQVAAGDEPCRAGFSGDVLALLAGRGFEPAESARYLAIFFQIRRAYYFIARSLPGHAPCMRALRRRLWDNVFTHDIRWYERYLWDRMEDFSTLLLGETGTGKGAAAAAIGRSGFIPFDARAQSFRESFVRSFVAINLSQYPESLIESELFGHRKGAFSGAVGSHAGVLSRCSPCGATFLDEIGEVAPPVQVKLLQVLQERVFSPVGSHERRRFEGRVIAATNQPLDRLRAEGRFRDDFFYRLCSDVIVVPPLRERLREDAGELAELLGHIVRRLTGRDSPDLAAAIEEALGRHPGPDYAWPGNVRELEQAVRRFILTRSYRPEPAAETPDLMAGLLGDIEAGALSTDELLAAYSRLLYRRHGSYEAVARRMKLDRRTVRKYVTSDAGHPDQANR